MCNNNFIIYLHRISGEKNYDEEGKEMKKGKKTGKKECSPDLARFEFGVHWPGLSEPLI